MPLALLLLLAFQEEPAFRTEVKLVHVDAEVRHKERLVEGLTKDDFRITDNGKPQAILYVAQEEEPLDIILLLDVSISMRPAIEEIANGVRQSLAQLHEGDRVAVWHSTANLTWSSISHPTPPPSSAPSARTYCRAGSTAAR